MSKFEIVNTYIRSDLADLINDKNFYERIGLINKDVLSSSTVNDNGYEGYGELIILPEGYYPLTCDEIDTTYIGNNSNSFYKINYYPGLEKDSEDFEETTVITKIPKQKIYLEKEYILERASMLTEDKYGNEKTNQLLSALEEVRNGVYKKFTNKEQGRDKLKSISPEEISQLMRKILHKYDWIEKNQYIYESDVRELFVKFIKEKVKKEKMERNKYNVLSLTDLLTKMD